VNAENLLNWLVSLPAPITALVSEVIALADAKNYNPATTYNETGYLRPSFVYGSDGRTYVCVGENVVGDNPVGSITGNWNAVFLSINDLYDVVHNDIIGGNITVSGNTLTIEPCGCWDSTRSVWLETSVNKDVILPSDVNQDYFVFEVRLVADGTSDFKAYMTINGPESDALVDAWRQVSFAKNNGAGVIMPFRQNGDDIYYSAATSSGNLPQLTATVAATLTGYPLSTVIPTLLKGYVEIRSLAGGGIAFSQNGTDVVWEIASEAVHPLIPANDTLYFRYSSSSSALKIRRITLRR